uniref:polynucleotide adenylyltransferase n=1 Tax=Globisporangium ultimum (strain ATCC 200006 / CBS 805.95 / DAOM BR144) TaxID=431595 RepID=K3WW93_GLOUD
MAAAVVRSSNGPASGSTTSVNAPLSWKDAVKNGVPAAPKPVAPSSRASTTTTKRDHHHRDHRHDQKPRQTTCPRAKLLRSRSVSRIAESAPAFRKRNDSVQSTGSSSKLDMSHHEINEKKSESRSKPSLSPRHRDEQGLGSRMKSDKSLKSGEQQQQQQPPVVKKKSALDSAFASPRKCIKKIEKDSAKEGVPAFRGRSASADLVLLQRSASWPVWRRLAGSKDEHHGNSVDEERHSKDKVSPSSVHFAMEDDQWNSTATQQTRKDRAMSVPDSNGSACSTARVEDAKRIPSKRVQREPGRAVVRCESLSSSARYESSAAPVAEEKGKNALAAECGDDDLSELDNDDTNSESTAESSCPSPRHSPVAGFGLQRQDRGINGIDAHHSLDDHDVLSDVMSLEEEQDFEALMLLDRINDLSAEFMAHREYEEANALSWSVEHAARQCVISQEVAQNLYSSIHMGALDEARDVLYHKCHLVPAVGSVVENATSVQEIHPSINSSFLEYVDELSPTDAPEARDHKMQVLKLLSDLLTRWVKQVGHERGLSEEHIALTSGSLFLAGSYRLGLNDPNSDIDAVCVVPYHVTHEDFFSSFSKTLELTDGVTHLAPVPNAYVPLISLSFLGVSMDLLFARLPMSCVESHQEIDSDHMLVGVHAASMKSLNAPRVSSMLLCLVPKRRVFRIVLRAVRTWARRRGIYSAKLGYLGGISWAILVAFVCQLYPDAEPAKVFVRFFQVMSEWQWPQPVMLNVIYDAGLGFEMWDPRQNIYDRAHIMPIITPAYPHMNSSVQVSQSTFSVIYEEFWRARYLAETASGIPSSIPGASTEMQDASDMKFGGSSGFENLGSFYMGSESTMTEYVEEVPMDIPEVASCPWEKLFEPSNMFIRYGTYLVVDFQADTPSNMHKWGKFVSSRLRKLVDSVQHVTLVSRVHAYPTYFPHTSNGSTPGSCMFIGIEFHCRRQHQNSMMMMAPPLLPKDDPEVKSNLEQTIRFFMATDLQQFEDKHPSMTAEARLLNWEDLPEFVFPNGRAFAEDEREKYQLNLEAMGFSQTAPSFRPSYYSNSYVRGGRWRGGGPRRYNGAAKGKHPRFPRDGMRTYPITQAG